MSQISVLAPFPVHALFGSTALPPAWGFQGFLGSRSCLNTQSDSTAPPIVFRYSNQNVAWNRDTTDSEHISLKKLHLDDEDILY